MSAATAEHVPPPRATTAAVVIGGEAHARGHTAGLLRDAGFSAVRDRSAAGEGPEHGALIVVLCADGDAARGRELRTAAQAHPDSPILAVMPADAPHASLRRALLAGAAGIVFDADAERALGPAARAVLAGQLTVPSALSRQIAPQPLSFREKQVLGLVELGLTNREIAGKLYLAESTVKTHLSAAFRKLDARSRSEAVERIHDPDAGYAPRGLAVVESPVAVA